jgi:lipopolysaccharide biosynthesis glycosyltransferase
VKIFIGYDEQFEKNLKVQINSLIKNCKIDLEIFLLNYKDLKGILYREREKLQTTDSAFTRWLVPHLSNYKGWSLYMDSDMYCRGDISELFNLVDNNYSVMVVKHKINSKENQKFNNNKQTYYDRKNWSSLILFNNSKCRNLNLEYVNKANGLDLHQFKWIKDEEIGELDISWNHLVGINQKNPNAKIVHWTLGGPWFEECTNTEFSEEWFKEFYQLKTSQDQN